MLTEQDLQDVIFAIEWYFMVGHDHAPIRAYLDDDGQIELRNCTSGCPIISSAFIANTWQKAQVINLIEGVEYFHGTCGFSPIAALTEEEEQRKELINEVYAYAVINAVYSFVNEA